MVTLKPSRKRSEQNDPPEKQMTDHTCIYEIVAEVCYRQKFLLIHIAILLRSRKDFAETGDYLRFEFQSITCRKTAIYTGNRIFTEQITFHSIHEF